MIQEIPLVIPKLPKIMIDIYDMDTMDSDDIYNLHQDTMPMAPLGFPPEKPLEKGLDLPRYAPESIKKDGVRVCLHRGYQPGWAWGELLVQRDGPDYRVVRAWLPHFQKSRHPNHSSFCPIDVHVVYVDRHHLDRYSIVEIRNDQVVGPCFCWKGVHGEIQLQLNKYWPTKRELFVDEPLQVPLEVLTGIRFKQHKDLLAKQAAAKAEAESKAAEARREKEQRQRAWLESQRKRQPHRQMNYRAAHRR